MKGWKPHVNSAEPLKREVQLQQYQERARQFLDRKAAQAGDAVCLKYSRRMAPNVESISAFENALQGTLDDCLAGYEPAEYPTRLGLGDRRYFVQKDRLPPEDCTDLGLEQRSVVQRADGTRFDKIDERLQVWHTH